MVKNIYLLLGLPDGAPWSDVKVAYARFMENLCARDQDERSETTPSIEEARRHLVEAWEHMKNTEVRSAYGEKDCTPSQMPAPAEPAYARPKLGQLLVASGLLTLAELDSVLEIQHNTRNDHVKLGGILVAAGYIDESQLSYYLRMQEVLQLPSDHPQRWGQRLLELGLVSEDQLKIALIEQKTTGCTLREAFLNRGWLAAHDLDRIF